MKQIIIHLIFLGCIGFFAPLILGWVYGSIGMLIGMLCGLAYLLLSYLDLRGESETKEGSEH